jgi:predicted ATPase/class 3 adenylate cyclase/DNA-binding CsgD family transcriptional regulator
MFDAPAGRMLASMSEIDLRADAPPVNWDDVGVSELMPAGTVTLLLADVEASTRLWETQPDEMTAAVARLDRTVSEVVAAHGGVRPVEQGEGDSFVVAFARASDAVRCALELQRAPLAPIRLRIGVHTGEVQLRDEGNYIGPTINRTARLRDLAHGGQTVLSGVTEAMVVDSLPPDAWLTDLGTHQLRDLPRPERVVQLCHPDLRNEFPPLRTPRSAETHHLPVQLTSFVGRVAQMDDVRTLLADNRLVTLTGAGGAGKTRLAVEIAARIAAEFSDGAWYVDLAPITHPAVVPVAVARALGLPDQPGRSTMDTLIRIIGDRQMLMMLDNCEHLLDATAALVVALVEGCPAVTLLATSREPIGVAGEVSWRVPSLSLNDEAIELFSDRARRVRPDFRLTDANAATVAEICRRLDGLPLAIELAAARVRALSLAEILDGLHDRFRLLTGGARTAVRRQQTLLASVDWSHALLTQPERVLFRRLAVFLGGFDLDAAQFVCGGNDVERYQVLDALSLLVDKSLVVADDSTGRTRYRLLETVRQYAMEKLGESGEADAVRDSHRDHYTAMAAQLDTPAPAGHELRLDQVETEIDNLRAAFGWSLENSDTELALQLASSLQSLWLARGHLQEGLAWLATALAAEVPDRSDASAARVRAIADKGHLVVFNGLPEGIEEAERALITARELNDPGLLVRALTAVGGLTAFADPQGAEPYFAEAADIARQVGDLWRLSQILGRQALAALFTGDPVAAGAAAEEGRQLAEVVGDRFNSRQCRFVIGWAQTYMGDLAGAVAQLRGVIDEATAAHDVLSRVMCLLTEGFARAYQGDASGARAIADVVLKESAELAELYEGYAYATIAVASLAAGDATAAWQATEAARQFTGLLPATAAVYMWAALAPLACGDVSAARVWADEVVTLLKGCDLSSALATRARVSMVQGDMDQAEHDIHQALAVAVRVRGFLVVPHILECLADLASDTGSPREAARFFGAADAARQRMGAALFKIHDADNEASVTTLRDALGEKDFAAAWGEGAALSTEEAIAYAQRGRGERKRPSSGWASLTPAERDVVRLVREGLANKDIATRLFVSPRNVQTHLTHVYTKLGITSRMQLAQEAARHA